MKEEMIVVYLSELLVSASIVVDLSPKSELGIGERRRHNGLGNPFRRSLISYKKF
ncbi:hypothetical protein HAX54_013990, partial [Datura stramonium]|nr:hypothetical protein [Datura stramonium]